MVILLHTSGLNMCWQLKYRLQIFNSMTILSNMKKHLHFSLLTILLLFQIILYCSMNRVGAVDADTDTLALLSFKSVVSDSQNVLSGWNQNSSHCTWFGVTCANKGTRVQSLRLAGYGLSGMIHPHLSNLTCLQLRDLYNNSFYGQL